MMEEKFARRDFLKAGASSLLAVGAELLNSPFAQASPTDGTPVASKAPRLLSACCAYTYRRSLLHGPMTMEDFIRKAVELKLDAVDITVYYLKSTDPAYLEGLRHLGYKNAVTFSGAACGVSMVQADAAKRAAGLDEIKKWIDVADRLGTSHLRVFAGKLPPGASLQNSIDWVVEAMKPASDYAAEKGIMLGLEDHQGVSQSADVCLEVVHRVNSPYAGITLDITHFVPTPQQDAYAQIAACIPYANVAHIRDHFDDHTPIDLDRVWQLFAAAGFKGYMSFEGDEIDSPNVPQVVSDIQMLCRKYSSVS
jgi:sugar phosphate isomerase/epimerase